MKTDACADIPSFYQGGDFLLPWLRSPKGGNNFRSSCLADMKNYIIMLKKTYNVDMLNAVKSVLAEVS